MKLHIRSILLTILLSLTITGCGGGNDSGSSISSGNNPGGSASIPTYPSISYTTPANNATGVATNSSVTVTFDREMDPSTINAATIFITGITGTVTYNTVNKIATFTPDTLFNSNTTYIANVTTGAKDLTGNALPTNYSWTFTTSSTTDTSPPIVTSRSPADSATGIPVNTSVVAVFNEPINLTSLDSAFTLQSGSTTVPGTIEFIGTAAAFKPTANLTANTLYTATVSTTAMDLAGNHLASPVVWSFTTGNTTDTTTPTVVPGSEIPLNGSTISVLPLSPFSIQFSEPIYPFLFGTINGIPGTVEFDYSTNRVTMTPTQPLDPNITYAAAIKAKDLSGNQMITPFTWSFSTKQ